jgi:hypothetical protein
MHASQVKCSIMLLDQARRGDVMGGRTILWPRRTNHLLVSPTRVMNVVDETKFREVFYDDIQD